MATIKEVIPALTKALNAFPVGDKRRQALMRSLTALEAHFGKSENAALMPAAAQQITQAAKMGQGMPGHSPAPPGMSLGGPAPSPGGLGAMAGGA
jgi:hypothetical protein